MQVFGVEVWLHTFLTSVLDVMSGYFHVLAAFMRRQVQIMYRYSILSVLFILFWQQ
jgi:hypothetical protein